MYTAFGRSRNWRTTGGSAVRDADIARGLYRSIAGFDEADRHLRSLDRIHAPAAPRKPRPRWSYLWR